MKFGFILGLLQLLKYGNMVFFCSFFSFPILQWMPIEDYAAQPFNQKQELFNYVAKICFIKVRKELCWFFSIGYSYRLWQNNLPLLQQSRYETPCHFIIKCIKSYLMCLKGQSYYIECHTQCTILNCVIPKNVDFFTTE